MENILARIDEFFKKGNKFQIIIAILFVLIVIASIWVSFFGNIFQGKPKPSDNLEVVDNGDSLTVTDTYSGRITIPKYSFALNALDKTAFGRNENNFMTYPDAHFGIDVSEHQGEVDWEKMKEAGVDFAMIRAGYRGYTRGRTFDDTYFEQNMLGAEQNGIKVGVYYFSQAVTTAEAEEEAGIVLSLIKSHNVDYPIFFDWEPIDYDDARTDNLDGAAVTDIAFAFCDKITKAGYNAGVYVNKHQMYEFYNLEKLNNFDIWYAEYQNSPSQYYAFTIWQYTSNGILDGIDGTVDLNLCFKEYSK